MYRELTIGERLKDMRTNRRLRLEDVAEQTGLSKSALGKYESDDAGGMNHYAVVRLAEFYGVSTDFLLGLTENKRHPNTALDELHLSDDAIDVLKSGKINSRLLSELISHVDFRRLMVDMEIYVDRIASMRIQDLNALLEAVRQAVIEKYAPDEDDLHLRTLQAAQIQEDEYFSHLMHEDMDRILRDIREEHKKDRTTADSSGTEQAKQSLDEAIHFEGSDQEKQVRVFCAQLGIDYGKLTQEEFTTLISVLKKSKHLKSASSRRGKGAPQTVHGKGKRRK